MRSLAVGLIALSICATSAVAQDNDRAGATVTFEAFYAAMKKGDAAAVM